MFRLALTPRWLGLLTVALAIATAFAFLGTWQLSRARQQAPEPEKVGARPITEIFAPHAELDTTAALTPVIVTGTVDTAHPATLITDRRYRGAPVSWVVVPVQVEGGARLPVVLGVIPAGEPAPEIRPAPVHVETFLQSSEEPGPAAADGSYRSLGVAQYLNAWGPPVYSAFVFGDQATADAAAPGVGVTALPQQPPATDDGGFAILNLSYALQWWVFAAFAVFIWWRMLERAHATDQQQDQTVETPQRQLS